MKKDNKPRSVMHQDLTGCIVIVKASAMKDPNTPEFERRFRCTGGFGCMPDNLGKVFGHWYHSGDKDIIRRTDIEEIVIS